MKLRSLTVVAVTISAMVLSVSAAPADNRRISEVPFTAVKMTDSFWAPRIHVNRTVSIPSAFGQCEVNGRFDNFAIAAGLMEGEHRGDFSFDDTDPYKIIEGASYSIASEYDSRLDAYLDSVINIIAAAQEPDGYLTTCVTNRCERLSGWWGKSRWERINSHELYNSGHLIEAAVAHYRSTGKRTLLDVAIRNADLICEVFGPRENQKHVPSGHPIIEMALARLYRVTGERRYLDTALYFIEETGRGSDGHTLSPYSQDHMPILEQKEIVGHAVRAGYLYSGVADVASLLGRDDYFDALRGIWNNMVSEKLFITGGIGSRPQGEGFGPGYELHSHTAYCETCAAIANVYWNHRMFLATGSSDYYDVLERALYNGVISGVSLSGDRFFYDNPLESMGEHQRSPWFGCACCPGNITRFMASVPGYMYATRGSDVYVNLFAESSGEVATASNTVEIAQNTAYPWDGTVGMRLSPARTERFTLRIRIPGWTGERPVPSGLYSFADSPSRKIRILVNGKETDWTSENGYAVISKKWKKGDTVNVEFPMDVRRIYAREEVSDLKGKTALQRGPVVYCLEEADNAGDWLFDVSLPSDVSFSAEYDPGLLGGIACLKGHGVKEGVTVGLTAVPYCVWNNRGPGQMAVWIPETPQAATPRPAVTIASAARMYSEPTGTAVGEPAATSNLQEAWGYNDGWEPRSSSDNSKPYHYWWLKRGTEENICYGFDSEQEISAVEVYWLDMDHYDGDFRVPQNWRLSYLDADGRWREVATKDEYGVEPDRYNRIDFNPVRTRGLRIDAQLRPGVSGGVIEWKVE